MKRQRNHRQGGARDEAKTRNTKLLILADAGHFKAYRLEESERFSKPRLELLEQWETNVVQPLSEVVTDQAGRFRRRASLGGASDPSDGEEHHLEEERRKRALRAIAKRISEMAERDHFGGVYLAAGREINQSLVDELSPTVRPRLEKNVMANLTNLEAAEVIPHFYK